MMERKAFLANQSINIVYPNVDSMIVVTITKRMGIIMGIQVCLILQVNINYKENRGKKRFFCKSKASISYIPMWKT